MREGAPGMESPVGYLAQVLEGAHQRCALAVQPAEVLPWHASAGPLSLGNLWG